MSDLDASRLILQGRANRRLTRLELSELSGVSINAITRIEQVGGGRWRTICTLLKALGYEVSVTLRTDK